MNYFRFFYFFILISASSQSLPYKYIPKMVVFDLDFTLWPFWVDIDVIPPFHKHNDTIIDCKGKELKPYQESLRILKYLKDNHIKIGVFAKTFYDEGTNELLNILGWDKFIDAKLLLPADTRERIYNNAINEKNLQKFSKMAGVDLSDMLFIDDVYKNTIAFNNLKVTSYLVQRGLNFVLMKFGLQKYNDVREYPDIEEDTEVSEDTEESKDTETHTKHTEAHTKQTEAHAKHTETHTKQTEAHTKQTEAHTNNTKI